MDRVGQVFAEGCSMMPPVVIPHKVPTMGEKVVNFLKNRDLPFFTEQASRIQSRITPLHVGIVLVGLVAAVAGYVFYRHQSGSVTPQTPPPVQLPTQPEQPPTQPVQPPTPPEQTPTQPEQTPTQPEQTPTQPEQTPTQPVQPPTPPEQTPTQPEQTPTQPEQTPTQPEQTPTQPEQTPTQLEQTPTPPPSPVQLRPPIQQSTSEPEVDQEEQEEQDLEEESVYNSDILEQNTWGIGVRESGFGQL